MDTKVSNKYNAPWAVREWPMNVGTDARSIEVTDCEGAAVCNDEPYYPAMLNKEYAHIIAVAPEMLAAIEFLLEMCWINDVTLPPQCDTELRSVVKKAKRKL